jgi:hypothetical protein
MSSEKKLKRGAKAIWDAVKQERRERAKMFSAEKLAQSGERLAKYARGLKQLSKQVAALEAEAARPPSRKKKSKAEAKPSPTKSPARKAVKRLAASARKKARARLGSARAPSAPAQKRAAPTVRRSRARKSQATTAAPSPVSERDGAAPGSIADPVAAPARTEESK